MSDGKGVSPGARILFSVASFVIVVAGMKAASSILIPFLLSVFIAIICTPPLFWMRKKGVPDGLAIVVIILVIVAVGAGLSAFVGASVTDFSNNLPEYRQKLMDKTSGLFQWLGEHGVDVSEESISKNFNPGTAMQMAAKTLTSLSGVLSNAFLILLTVIFILLEASAFPAKLRTALYSPEKSLSGFRRFTQSVNRYLALKTIFSLITGFIIFIWLTILGVDYAALWGLLAFALNYIPNIGSIIAAVPAVLLTLVQLGTGHAIAVAAGYFAANTIVGSVLEPRFMGKGLGLSTLIVFLSLVFWGWVLGPVGMLLSVPLTMILKIALESNEDTRWLAVLLGSSPPAPSVKKEKTAE